ncbi:MAG: AAA family ATPase, partial [Desulfobacteraceae bacterium]|nr:AAA family ATPase [Desulfobacteraceae bacterium]
SGARGVLGSHGWNKMNVNLGPRYGGIGSSLAALTLGLRTSADEKPKFIPFERLSAGEKYSLSFALARAQVPGEQPPVILMEEPETALHPSAVATLLGDLQAIPAGEAPQIITSSHSESVLRCFSTEDVFIVGGDRQPRRLKAVIERVKPSGGPLLRTEYLIMPGGPSALFAEKILIVEGAQDAIVSGYLDRLAAKISAVKRSTYLSFLSLGWCIFETSKATWAQASADILIKLGKQVAILLDGDGPGKDAAVKTKDICPTFVYHSKTSSNPTLEDALLLGLPQKQKDEVLDEFLAHPECSTCDKKEKKCWKQKGECKLGDINYRKRNLQDLCLKCYLENQLFPPAFKALLSQLDSAEAGTLYQLPIDAQVDALTV